MKKVLGLLVCVTLIALVVGSASACWMFLSIAEMEEQAGLIVIAQLTGDVRDITREGGSGVTFWSVSVEYVLKGECDSVMEVATGGFITKGPEQIVMMSTDYRLDSYGDLFLLYLHDDYSDGLYWPVTPRGIVSLVRSEDGAILGAYDMVSQQHEEEYDEIVSFISKYPSKQVQTYGQLSAEGDSEGNSEAGDKNKPVVLAFLGVLMVASVGGIAVIRRQR